MDWKPSGPVLLLQSKPSASDVLDVRTAVRDCPVVVLNVTVQQPPNQRWRRAALRGLRGGARLPQPDDQASQALTTVLQEDPTIKAVLALDSGAQRIAQGVLKDRSDVLCFGRIDHLSRVIDGQIPVTMTPKTARMVDFNHTHEAISQAAHTPRLQSDLPLLVVGPDNTDGLANGIVTAVVAAQSTNAVSIAIAGDGCPADFMVSSSDWEIPDIRAQVQESAAQATHMLVASRHSADITTHFRGSLAYVQGFEATSNAKPEFTLDPRRANAETHWLPLVLPPGVFVRQAPIGVGKPRVLLIRERTISWGTALGLAALARADIVTLVDLETVAGPIRLPTAASCNLILDLRESPLPDSVVLAGLAGGATLISDFSDWAAQVEPPPHERRGSDPITALAILAARSATNDGASTGIDYTIEHHNGASTARALSTFLARVR